MREDQREEVNWEPLSEVRVWGMPKWEIHLERKASAHEDEELEERVLSIILRMCEYPREVGRGPTMSTWTWENLLSGVDGGEIW